MRLFELAPIKLLVEDPTGGVKVLLDGINRFATGACWHIVVSGFRKGFSVVSPKYENLKLVRLAFHSSVIEG
jgi:hypothetical protein